MAIEETATVDQAIKRESNRRDADVEDVQIEGLFCKCGNLLEPMPCGRFSCPSCDTQVESNDLSLVLETPQNDRRDLTIGDGSEFQDDRLEYSRSKYCDACGQEQEVEARVVQTRSADEPPTRQYVCRACGKRWREHG